MLLHDVLRFDGHVGEVVANGQIVRVWHQQVLKPGYRRRILAQHHASMQEDWRHPVYVSMPLGSMA